MWIRTLPTALALTLLTAVAPAAGAPLDTPVEAGRFGFDRALVLPTPAISATVREGGLSGLQLEPGSGNRRFVSVSGRGPTGRPPAATGGRTFLSPAFAPYVYTLAAEDDGRLSVLGRTALRVPGVDPLRGSGTFPGDLQLITGIRNVTTAGLDPRTYRMTSSTTFTEVVPADPYGVAPEGVARDPRDGSFWVADEQRASLIRFDAGGVMRQRVAPIGTGELDTFTVGGASTLDAFYDDTGQPAMPALLPAEYRGRGLDGGFTGVALNADATKLYGVMGRALDTTTYPALTYDGATCTTLPTQTPAVRVVELDISNPGAPTVTGEWLYPVPDGRSVTELSWTGPRRLLLTESESATGPRALYETSLATGTNLLTTASTDTYAERQAPAAGQPHLGCVLDAATPAELTTAAITRVSRSLYLDLDTTGVAFDGRPEGATLLDGGGVAVVDDNDFGIVQAPETNLVSEASAPGEQLRFYATRPSAPTPTISGTPTGGRTLTCAAGSALSPTYTWLRGGSPIAGATEPRYTLSAEDVGAAIACRVVATRAAGAVRAPSLPGTSTPTAAVAPFTAGAPGSPGSQGPQGVPGPQGDAGTAGSNGAAGPQGGPGNTGAQGPAGAQGPQGVSGPRGATGATGPLPKVSCKLTYKGTGKRRTLSGVTCTVSAPATARRIVARAAGRTLVSAVVRRGRATLRLPRSGRRATLIALDAKGHTLRSSRVTVG